jgi:DNA repair protein RecO (recombination protein O)
MQWKDEAIVLAVRRHGETSAVLEVLAREHGRSLGLVRGGRSRRMRPVLQAGNSLAVTWNARLEEHLGLFVPELLSARAAHIMDDGFKLAGLSTVTALAHLLPEREPHHRIYDAMVLLLDHLDDDSIWPALLARWELGLLHDLGFGLDLGRCAATGGNQMLAFVSPKSGRAVSLEAGEPYRERLLRLPSFLTDRGGRPSFADIADALKLTGYFVERHLLTPRELLMPEGRSTIVERLERAGAKEAAERSDAGKT